MGRFFSSPSGSPNSAGIYPQPKIGLITYYQKDCLCFTPKFLVKPHKSNHKAITFGCNKESTDKYANPQGFGNP